MSFFRKIRDIFTLRNLRKKNDNAEGNISDIRELLLIHQQNLAKNILVISPSFTGDCLETIFEIGVEYEELFIEKGGQKLDYVPSLNSNDNWVKCIEGIVRRL